jgi:ATP-dependent Clp protease ATP-binding subunit ClpA
MFDRLSGDSHHALEEARAEAGRLGHDFVGTEHLLLGVLDVGDPAAGALLTRNGVVAEMVRAHVARAGAFQQPPSDLPPLSLTARAKQVMALAGKEADDLGNSSVAPAHLLLGIIRQGTGVAALVLKDFGVDLVKLRDDLLAAMTVRREGADDGAQSDGRDAQSAERVPVERDGDDDETKGLDSPQGRAGLVVPACPRCERPLSEHLVVSEIAPQDSSTVQAGSSRLPKRSGRAGSVVVVSCGACGYPLSLAR